MLRRETTFLDKASVLTWASCFLKFTKRVTSSQTIKRYTPKSESKIDTKNYEKKRKKKKTICLTTGQFLFSKYMTIKGLYISNNVCWVFDQKAWFSKGLFKKGHLWFHFNKLDFEQTWSLKYESWFQNKEDYWI